MGACPSKCTISLFSYFRGTYEVGLIPLTKHFFGADDDDQCDDIEVNGQQQQCELHALFSDRNNASMKQERIDLRDKTKSLSSAAAKTINRKQLRAQLVQMRRDSAVLYFNARDPETMMQSIKAHLLKKEEKIAAATENKNSLPFPLKQKSQEWNEEKEMTVSNADAALENSEDSIKCTLAPRVPLPSQNSSSSGEEITDDVLRSLYWDTMPEPNFSAADLDKFLELVDEALYETDYDMVNDVRYHTASVDATSECNDEMGCATNCNQAKGGLRQPAAFIPIPCALCLAYPEGKERPGCFQVSGRSINIIGYVGCLTEEMQKAFKVTKRATIPSAAERENGGIGDKLKSDELQGIPLQQQLQDKANKNDLSSINSKISPSKQISLYFNTAILTSAGDRTLERALVLAGVMLRQQFHAAHRRVLVTEKMRYGGVSIQSAAGITATHVPLENLYKVTAAASFPSSGSLAAGSCVTSQLEDPHHLVQQASLAMGRCRMAEGTQGSDYYSLDPFLSVALPPLPVGMFTPYTQSLLQEEDLQHNDGPVSHHSKTDGENDGKSSSLISQAANKLPYQTAVFHTLIKQQQQHSNQFFRSANSTQRLVYEVEDPSTGIRLTNHEEDAISWAFFRRLNSISIIVEASGNNYSALKSLTENLAFLHCQVHIDPNEATTLLVNLPGLTELRKKKDRLAVKDWVIKESNERVREKLCRHVVKAEAGVVHPSSVSLENNVKAPKEEGETDTEAVGVPTAPEPQYKLPSDAGVAFIIQPSYFRQAALWASCLFRHPVCLSHSHWIQYKLKDETEELRQVLQNKDMLIAHWRQQDQVRASTYLGPQTAWLLAHVQALQDETECVRALPLTHWEGKQLFSNQDGRKYALHHGCLGTMLIGVRTLGVSQSRLNKSYGAIDGESTTAVKVDSDYSGNGCSVKSSTTTAVNAREKRGDAQRDAEPHGMGMVSLPKNHATHHIRGAQSSAAFHQHPKAMVSQSNPGPQPFPSTSTTFMNLPLPSQQQQQQQTLQQRVFLQGNAGGASHHSGFVQGPLPPPPLPCPPLPTSNDAGIHYYCYTQLPLATFHPESAAMPSLNEGGLGDEPLLAMLPSWQQPQDLHAGIPKEGLGTTAMGCSSNSKDNDRKGMENTSSFSSRCHMFDGDSSLGRDHCQHRNPLEWGNKADFIKQNLHDRNGKGNEMASNTVSNRTNISPSQQRNSRESLSRLSVLERKQSTAMPITKEVSVMSLPQEETAFSHNFFPNTSTIAVANNMPFNCVYSPNTFASNMSMSTNMPKTYATSDLDTIPPGVTPNTLATTMAMNTLSPSQQGENHLAGHSPGAASSANTRPTYPWVFLLPTQQPRSQAQVAMPSQGNILMNCSPSSIPSIMGPLGSDAAAPLPSLTKCVRSAPAINNLTNNNSTCLPFNAVPLLPNNNLHVNSSATTSMPVNWVPLNLQKDEQGQASPHGQVAAYMFSAEHPHPQHQQPMNYYTVVNGAPTMVQYSSNSPVATVMPWQPPVPSTTGLPLGPWQDLQVPQQPQNILSFVSAQHQLGRLDLKGSPSTGYFGSI